VAYFNVKSLHLPEVTEETFEESQSEYRGSGPKFKPVHSESRNDDSTETFGSFCFR